MDYVRCSVCGKIMPKSKLKDFCPACGAKKQAFKPYELDLTENRMKKLGFHLHSIMVHFPQSIAFFLTIGSTILVIASESSKIISNTISTLGFIFPFTIALAIGAGIFDAKLRFKQIITPAIKIKIIVGGVAFLTSIVLLVLTLPNNIQEVRLVILILSILSLMMGGILGKIGGELICTYRKDGKSMEKE